MHDAGEKDTPPSDRLVVARKPLLPAPYARFYSSTRFRSVSRFSRARARLLSSPSKLFELWPQRHFGRASASGRPLEARSPYRSSDLRTLDRARSFIGNMFESSRAHSSIRSILELSSASLCFDPSLLVLSAEEKCRLWLYPGERFDQIFFFLSFFFWKDFNWEFDRFGIWEFVEFDDTYSERRVCASWKDSLLDFERIVGTKSWWKI